MADTVLVLTRPGDLTADLVVLELGRRGVPAFRADLADFPRRLTMTAVLGGGWAGSLHLPGRSVRLDQVASVYYRRPRAFEWPDGMSPADQAWADSEARHGLGGVLAALGCVWLPGEPLAAARAEFKPLQLAEAARVGLSVPATLITNSPREAAAFVSACPAGAVYKPVRGRPLAAAGRPVAVFTTPVTSGRRRQRRGGAHRAPVPAADPRRIRRPGDRGR